MTGLLRATKDLLYCLCVACVLCFVSYWAVYGSFGNSIRHFWEVDACMDRGCVWMSSRNECDCEALYGD